MAKKISKGSPMVLNVESEERILLSQVEEVAEPCGKRLGVCI